MECPVSHTAFKDRCLLAAESLVLYVLAAEVLACFMVLLMAALRSLAGVKLDCYGAARC